MTKQVRYIVRLPWAPLLLGALLIFGGNAMGYEEPGYEVVGQTGAVEYRSYKSYLIAETVVAGGADFDSAGDEGFRRLFSYISGRNSSQSKISMTTPVSQEAQSEKISMTAPVQQSGSPTGWRIAFMLPGKYTLDSAPVPDDTRIQLVAVPARLVAVLRYSGRWTERNYLVRLDELSQALTAVDVRTVGEPWLARYNAPFSLPFLRRNEVLVEVDRLPD